MKAILNLLVLASLILLASCSSSETENTTKQRDPRILLLLNNNEEEKPPFTQFEYQKYFDLHYVVLSGAGLAVVAENISETELEPLNKGEQAEIDGAWESVDFRATLPEANYIKVTVDEAMNQYINWDHSYENSAYRLIYDEALTAGMLFGTVEARNTATDELVITYQVYL